MLVRVWETSSTAGLEREHPILTSQKSGVVRSEFRHGGFQLLYCLVPKATSPAYLSTSDPHSIDMSFISNERQRIVRANGRVEHRPVQCGSASFHGDEIIDWVGDGEPAEYVEISLLPAYRRMLGDQFGSGGRFAMRESCVAFDPVIWSAASLIRSKTLGGLEWNDLEAEELVLRVS